MTQDILYCFDENYNKQALTSIISLLDNVSEPINIHVIHKNKSLFVNLPNVIKFHQNLNKFNTYEFEREASNFPNILNSHISEATYYRLFVEEILPNNIGRILYIDCDIICINDPIKDIKEEFESLSKSNKTIGVSIEKFSKNEEIEIFNRLNLSSTDYFNAGVMFIDFNKWLKKGVPEKSTNIIKKLGIKLKFWDQDVLNKIFNSDFRTIDKKFNFILDIQNTTNIPNGTLFVHYAGSFKPWTARGVVEKNAKLYTQSYRKLGYGNFHITHSWKLSSVAYLIKSIFTLKIFNTKKPINFIFSFINSLRD
tara:strand:- start:628 stop:1557 length:930 start_codon:yes stop_codon:yes gene_type:complete